MYSGLEDTINKVTSKLEFSEECLECTVCKLYDSECISALSGVGTNTLAKEVFFAAWADLHDVLGNECVVQLCDEWCKAGADLNQMRGFWAKVMKMDNFKYWYAFSIATHSVGWSANFRDQDDELDKARHFSHIKYLKSQIERWRSSFKDWWDCQTPPCRCNKEDAITDTTPILKRLKTRLI